MKKQVLSTFIALLLVFLFAVPTSADPNHNGSAFDYYTAHDKSFVAYSIGGELISDDFFGFLSDGYYYDNNYPRTHFIDYPTAKYNCHSYAWHSHSSSNNVWINMNITNYFADTASSVTNELTWNSNTSAGTVSIGDIVVFKDSSNLICHSAVVCNTTDGTLNNTQLISKWSNGCLMEHAVYSGHPYCDSSSVKVFRPISSHILSYTDLGKTKHSIDCSCGYYATANHINIISGNAYVCTRCSHSVDIMIHDPEEEY